MPTLTLTLPVEEEAASHYRAYLSSLPPGVPAKPVVGFIAGLSTERGKTYGHAGAVWYAEAETAAAKRRVWREAGIEVANGLGEVVGLVREAMRRLEQGGVGRGTDERTPQKETEGRGAAGVAKGTAEESELNQRLREADGGT